MDLREEKIHSCLIDKIDGIIITLREDMRQQTVRLIAQDVLASQGKLKAWCEKKLADASSLLTVPQLISGANLGKLDAKGKVQAKCEFDTFNDFCKGVLQRIAKTNANLADLKELTLDIKDNSKEQTKNVDSKLAKIFQNDKKLEEYKNKNTILLEENRLKALSLIEEVK